MVFLHLLNNFKNYLIYYTVINFISLVKNNLCRNLVIEIMMMVIIIITD